MLHLATFGSAQTDDSPDFASFNKGPVVQRIGLRSQRDHAQLLILKPIIQPHKRGVPVEVIAQVHGDAMIGDIGRVFDWIKPDSHIFTVATVNMVVKGPNVGVGTVRPMRGRTSAIGLNAAG